MKPGKEGAAIAKAASRARARNKFRAEREESQAKRNQRIRHVRFLIESSRWLGETSEAELQVEWKLSHRTVRRYVEEAKGRIRDDFEGRPREERIAVMTAACDYQLTRCNQEQNRSAWVRVAEFQARLLGLEQPTKVEVSGTLGDMLAGLPDSGPPDSPAGEVAPAPGPVRE